MKKARVTSLLRDRGPEDYTEIDTATLHDRIAEEFDVVKAMMTSHYKAIGKELVDERARSRSLQKEVYRLTAMVDLLSQQLAGSKLVDLEAMRGHLDEAMRALEPEPEPQPAAPADDNSPYRGRMEPQAAPIRVSADPFAPIVPPDWEKK